MVVIKSSKQDGAVADHTIDFHCHLISFQCSHDVLAGHGCTDKSSDKKNPADASNLSEIMPLVKKTTTSSTSGTLDTYYPNTKTGNGKEIKAAKYLERSALYKRVACNGSTGFISVSLSLGVELANVLLFKFGEGLDDEL
ncbi:unnamed protein product [Angiostrongylus costaricensis]|uniref:ADP/ATP translocase n=1 Tax=Angiostrongylus costaricensis TaxID=334426 RepID=A0A158PM60_ANGCS|nr:unnamed protein product [Angiostrongylus costaricensis]